MRILIRGGKPPHVPVSPEASLARWGWGIFGGNVGNTLFLESVYKALNTPTAEMTVDSLYVEQWKNAESIAADINAAFDVYVIPLANAFRNEWTESLSRLTAIIELLTIPVVVVGVGGQSELDEDMSRGSHDETTRRFVRAVLDRSASIGVRGERTAAYLRTLGFGEDVVDIIGCPSLFDHDGDLTVRPAPDIHADSEIGFNLTPHVPGMGPVITHNAERYRRFVYVAQEHDELAMLLWGRSASTEVEDLPLHTGHRLYREDRIRFFLDPTTWKAYLRERDFVFGNRIHGNIAALAVGTPAVLLAHDSRTQELADYHRVPYRVFAGEVVDAADLRHDAQFDSFNAFMPEAFGRYTRFLERNGLAHIHQPGNAALEYRRMLAGVPFHTEVRSFASEMSPFERELLRKLEWIRQGAKTDAGRWVGGYMPEWRPSA